MDTECVASRVRPDIQDQPNADTSVETIRVSQIRSPAQGASGTGGFSHPEECNRAGPGHEKSRILLPRISRGKEERFLETSDKSTCSESVPRHSNIFHGVGIKDSSQHYTERMGNIVRPDRRILPCASGTAFQEVPPVRHKREGLPVYGPPVRSVNGSAGIYQDAVTSGSSFPQTGNQIPPISGRLIDEGIKSSSGTSVDRDSHTGIDESRIPHKHHQVYARSSSTLRVHWSPVSDRLGSHDTSRGSLCQYPGEDDRTSYSESSSSHSLALTAGSTRVCRETSTDGKTLHSTYPGLSTQTVQDSSTPTDSSCSAGYQCSGSVTVVDRQDECFPWPGVGPIRPTPNLVHRRKSNSLGGTRGSRRFRDERSLVTDGMSYVNQSARVVSSAKSATSGTSVLGRQTNLGGLRQLDDGIVPEQVWRNEVDAVDGVSLGAVPVCSASLTGHKSSSYSRQTEQASRFSLEDESGGRYRMDDGSVHSETDLEPVGNTQHRPNGNQHLEAATRVHLSIPGSVRIRSRRNILRLDGNGRVHLSALADDCASVGQTASGKLCRDGNLASLAEPSMVPKPSGSAGREPTPAPTLPRVDNNAAQPLSARQSSGFASTRLQAIFKSATDQGFSREVSRRIATGQHRGSTQNIYCSRWKAFDSWCCERACDPRSATVAQLAEFLLHLFQVKKLSPSAIAGYRSAINSVWRVSGRTATESYHLTQLMKSFKAERPRSLVVHPKWDLALVMSMLTKPPFEPLQQASFRDLGAKTVFLLLLASSRRRGDIHAIDPKRVTFTDRGVVLVPCPGYLPKISSTAEGQRRYQPIVIRRLNALTADQSELTLCPVRALRLYDAKAKELAPDRRQFFLSSAATARPVSKNTLSAWMTKLIRRAYALATDNDVRPYSTSTHEVRALAASLALQANFSLANVLNAATWASPTTFTEFYLRETSGLQGRLHVIAPCVVAGTTLH